MQEADLPLLVSAIKEAGRIATKFAQQPTKSWDKPGGAGPVTEADLAVNTYLEEHLRRARPTYGWLSEETEDNADRLACETVFIVDPIDGTRSFVEGSKTWAHSIAIAHAGVVTAGAIYLPLRDLLYTAARGTGAWLNGTRMETSLKDTLGTADVLAAKPMLAPEHWPTGVPGFTRAHRPSLAYRLGLVGQGRFDAMLTLRPTWEWDVAAGALIVEEANGTCSNRHGHALRFNNPTPQLDGMIAAGRNMHAPILRAMGH
ncbi:MAG: 3'(2'),5'-bisphosphate nucleotidase CysQ [Roseobacter sp.]